MDLVMLILWTLSRPLAVIMFAVREVLLDVTRLSPRRLAHLACVVALVFVAVTIDSMVEAILKGLLIGVMLAFYVGIVREQDRQTAGESEPVELSPAVAIIAATSVVVAVWFVHIRLLIDIANGGRFDEGWISPVAYWFALTVGSEPKDGSRRTWRDLITPPVAGSPRVRLLADLGLGRA